MPTSGSSSEVTSLQDSISYTWEPTKTKLLDQQADILLLKTFFKDWEDAMNKGETNEQGYKEAVSKLPKDNPNTSNNEGITEKEILDKAKDFFEKPLGNVTSYDVKQLEANVGKLQEKVRHFLAYGNFCDDQIKDAEDRIRDINEKERIKGEYPDDNLDVGETEPTFLG